MINNKKELRFYIIADRIMAGLPPKPTFQEVFHSFVSGGGIIVFLKMMRKYSYFKHLSSRSFINRVLCSYYGFRYSRLSMKLGFTIGSDVFGYGLLIPHYGTIVINSLARVGNFAVLHTCTNIAGEKIIGDGLYMATGSQIVGNVSLGNYVTVCSNSLVNKCFGDHVLIGGVPARIIKDDYPKWYERDGDVFIHRVNQVNKYKEQMKID